MSRRRLLAVLVAFCMPPADAVVVAVVAAEPAVPVALGLVVASTTGIGLGAILLAVIDTGVRVAWLDVFAMVAAGAVVVLLVTAASLPVLFRTHATGKGCERSSVRAAARAVASPTAWSS